MFACLGWFKRATQQEASFLRVPDFNTHLAVGQKPNRAPSEHPNPTTNIGSRMGGEFTQSQPKFGIPFNGFDHHSHLKMWTVTQLPTAAGPILLPAARLVTGLLRQRLQRLQRRSLLRRGLA